MAGMAAKTNVVFALERRVDRLAADNRELVVENMALRASIAQYERALGKYAALDAELLPVARRRSA